MPEQSLTHGFLHSAGSNIYSVVSVVPTGTVTYITDNAIASNPLTRLLTNTFMSASEYPIFQLPATLIVGRGRVNEEY